MHILASGSPPPLPGFLNALAGPLDHLGYWAVLLFVMLEDFGIPVPGETVLIAAATFSAYALARARGLPLTEQRTAATLVALILSLCVLALLALPLTWRRILLLVAALAGFVLLFPVPAMRSFYALELPHGAIGSTLLIAALGAAALAGVWVLSPSTRPQTGEVTPE